MELISAQQGQKVAEKICRLNQGNLFNILPWIELFNNENI